MNKLPYAGWATMQLRSYYLLDDQDARKNLFSPSGKIKNYPYYVAYCARNKYEPDNPPPGYVPPISHGATAALVGVGFMATIGWFLAGVIGSGTGRMKRL